MQHSTWNTGINVGVNEGEKTANVELDNCFIYISVLKNASFATPVTVYPMLRLASDTDDTYAPYAMTNKELTDLVNTYFESTANSSSFVFTDPAIKTSVPAGHRFR